MFENLLFLVFLKLTEQQYDIRRADDYCWNGDPKLHSFRVWF
jgi:hypothetical protein